MKKSYRNGNGFIPVVIVFLAILLQGCQEKKLPDAEEIKTTVNVTEQETVEVPLETVPEELSSIIISEEGKRQLSSYAVMAVMQGYPGADGTENHEMTADDCLYLAYQYMTLVQFKWNGGKPSHPADLPYHWYSGRITREEMDAFFKDGLDIVIPADYTYDHEADGFYLRLADSSFETNYDAMTAQIVGGTVEVISETADEIILQGYGYCYDPDENRYDFEMTVTPGDNPDVFGGMTVRKIKLLKKEMVERKEVESNSPADYSLMAKKCEGLLDSLRQQGLFEDNSYAFEDIDKDGIPELIVQQGSCHADFQYGIYRFDGTEMKEQGLIPYGNKIYGYPEKKVIDVQEIHMGYEYIFRYDMENVEKISECQLAADTVTGYELPADAYELTMYYDFYGGMSCQADFIEEMLRSNMRG